MSEPQVSGHNGQLKSIVERIEHVEEEIKDLRGDKGEIYQEAKSNGFDVKVLRKVIAIRKMDPAARSEQETILETYMHALGEA
jgi:uncharacterized protein (UPF0335 family)